MTDKDLTDRRFYRAGEETQFAERAPDRTPQTEHPAYKLAFRDTDFLLRDELRPVRFQLELLKPEMLLDEARVGSTMVMYGSARIPSPEEAQARMLALHKHTIRHRDVLRTVRVASHGPICVVCAQLRTPHNVSFV